MPFPMNLQLIRNFTFSSGIIIPLPDRLEFYLGTFPVLELVKRFFYFIEKQTNTVHNLNHLDFHKTDWNAKLYYSRNYVFKTVLIYNPTTKLLLSYYH